MISISSPEDDRNHYIQFHPPSKCSVLVLPKIASGRSEGSVLTFCSMRTGLSSGRLGSVNRAALLSYSGQAPEPRL
jgi:hypothetical protein